jgi:hypothetical protein
VVTSGILRWSESLKAEMRDGGKIMEESDGSGWCTFRLSQEGEGGMNDDLAEESTKEMLASGDGDAVNSDGFTNS